MADTYSLDRRQLLKLGVVAGSVAAGLPLAACADSDPRSEQDSGSRLDLLRIGAADATDSTGLDPRTASAGASMIVMQHVYDSLMVLDGGSYQLRLAESVEPNPDGSVWTVRIRDDAVFHDGQPVRAADVAFSLQTLGSEQSNRASVYADVDVDNITVVDDLTVEVPLRRPRGDFRESILVVYSTVFPDGTTDFSEAIGSGPYQLERSDARTVRLVARDDHWSGRPTVATLEITRIADAAARLAAVKDGQLDYATNISATGAQTEQNNPELAIHRGGPANSSALSFAMNQRLAPFDDPRVRRAVRLAADRPALVANALSDLGTPGADVVGKDLPGYSESIVDRQRDLDTARQLFAEAGVTELTLRAAEIVPGMMAAAQLFAQQLAEVGVTLTVAEEPVDSYYADLEGLSSHPFQAFYYTNRPAAVHLAATTTEVAVFNVTGTGPDYWERLATAQLSVDDAARAAAFEALQVEFYESGGDLLWGYQETLDISRAGIGGVRMSQSVPLFHQATLL